MKASITLFVLVAAAIERCRAVVILNRGTASWTQGRVQALLDAGNITNDMLPDFRAVRPTDFQVDSVMLEWGVEKVRFSISIANIGANNLQARNGAIITNPTQSQIDYFKSLSIECGVPYQTLIDLYLLDCARSKKKLKIHWAA